jgi:hypothetical protein
MKASCLRNLFHQDRRWTENSIANFLGNWKKTSGAKLHKCGETTSAKMHHDNDTAHASLFVRQLLASTNTTTNPNTLLSGPKPLWLFPILQDETEAQESTFFSSEKIQIE